MVIEIVMPEIGKEGNLKDLIFSILADGKPKTLTQLHKETRKNYGLSVSFQAIMKAVNSLISKKVLIRKDMIYTINDEWIFESRNFIDGLYRTFFKVTDPIRKVELGKEIIVYTVNNLLELDRLWNDLLANWAKTEKEDKRNVWQGKHCWWLIPRLQEEDILHDLFDRQNINTYNLILENTSLDKLAVNYYKKRDEHITVNRKLKTDVDKQISAFGDFFVKFSIPEQVSKKLDKIYQRTSKLEDLRLKEVLDIFKENIPIELTVIKDRILADKIKEEIISYFS